MRSSHGGLGLNVKFYQEQIDELLLFAENELALQEKQGDGLSLRDHLESVERQTGITPDQLKPLPFPGALEYIWRDFVELSDERTTLNPISYTELEAWNRLTNKQATTQEIGVIKMLDTVFLRHHKQQQADKS